MTRALVYWMRSHKCTSVEKEVRATREAQKAIAERDRLARDHSSVELEKINLKDHLQRSREVHAQEVSDMVSVSSLRETSV